MADNDDYEILDDYYIYESMDPCYREPQRACLEDRIGMTLTDKVFDGTNYAEQECLYWSYLEFSHTMEYANVTNIERKFHGHIMPNLVVFASAGTFAFIHYNLCAFLSYAQHQVGDFNYQQTTF